MIYVKENLKSVETFNMYLVEENLPKFEKVHARSISLVDRAIERLGVKDSELLVDLFLRVADYVDESLCESGEHGHKW